MKGKRVRSQQSLCANALQIILKGCLQNLFRENPWENKT
jgi:hypothetical protein